MAIAAYHSGAHAMMDTKMAAAAAALLLSSTFPKADALDNGLGLTPARGWNRCDHEQLAAAWTS